MGLPTHLTAVEGILAPGTAVTENIRPKIICTIEYPPQRSSASSENPPNEVVPPEIICLHPNSNKSCKLTQKIIKLQ